MIAAAEPFGIASATYQASSSGIRWPSGHRLGAELGAGLDRLLVAAVAEADQGAGDGAHLERLVLRSGR